MKLRVLITLFFFIMLLCNKQADAQGFTTKGTDFWFSFLENYLSEDSIPTDEMKVYITADALGATGIISIPLAGWSQNFVVPPNSTYTIVMPTALAMCIESEIIENKGIHVQTDNEVSVYQLNYVQYTSDGNIVIPTPSLGKSYRVTTYDASVFGLYGAEITASELMVVAAYDSTYIRITPKCNTQGGHGANIPFTIMLRQGEVYQVRAYPSAFYGLNGTLIELDPSVPENCKTFAVFSGNKCVFVPTMIWACNHICEQMIPMNAWGKKYITVPLKTRSSDVFRIQAKQAGTIFTIDAGPPHGLNAGAYFEDSLSVASYIESNQPISVAQFSKGGQADHNEYSDPFMIMINPLEQSIKHIVFNSFTSSVISDYYLNIVTRTAYTNLVTLDGTNIGASFLPVGGNPQYSYAQITITQGNHVLDSDSGLLANVYGYGWYESYGYVAGTTVRDLEVSFTITANSATVLYYDLTDTICRGTNLVFNATLNPNVTNYTWSFGDGSPTQTGITSSHTYSNPGHYIIKLYYEKSGFCANDSLVWYVNIKCCNDPLSLTGTSSVCTGDTISITEVSTFNPLATYNWDFDGGTVVSGSGQGPYVLTWSVSGTDTVWVYSSEPQCASDSTFFIVNVSAVPTSGFQVVSPLCVGEPSTITYTGSASLSANYQWNFDGGAILSGAGHGPYTIAWSHAGSHIISLSVSDNSCTSTSDVTVTVFSAPMAQFTADPQVAFIEEPLIQFTDHSLNTSSWMWDFGDINSGSDNYSTLQFPSHAYSSQGSFMVWLIATSPDGCIDSAAADIQITGINYFFIPNAFTPNFDGMNEVFQPYSTEINYTLYIFNRWGEQLFMGKNEGWDGSYKGEIVKEDVYVWILIYSFYQEKEKMARGRVTVLK